MTNSLSQYEIDFPGKHALKIANDIGKIMNIPIDEEKIEDTMDNNGTYGIQNVCIFRDPDDAGSFIYLNCCNVDFLYTIVVRCRQDKGIGVRDKLLEWDKKLRAAYGQEIFDTLDDTIDVQNNLLNQTMKLHKIYNLDDIK